MNLIYTTVFDAPSGPQYQRQGAKMLVSSLLRTGFSGDIAVFSGSETPLFFIRREGVEEVVVDLEGEEGLTPGVAGSAWRFLAGDEADMGRYGQVAYLAPGTLALRNVDHLFAPGRTFGYQELPEGGGDPGLFAVPGEDFGVVKDFCLPKVAAQEGAEPRPDDPWQQFIGSEGRSRAARFEPGEVVYPLAPGVTVEEVARAAVLRATGGGWERRLSTLFGHYAGRFFWEPSGIVVNMFEP